MSQAAFENPVTGDEVPKINDEVAVGEDLEFQRRWWMFERIAWSVIAVLLLLDLAGAFGRGPLAVAHLRNAQMVVKYERIERADSPSILRVDFDPSVIHDGHVRLFVSESIVNELGAQRVIPAPSASFIGNGGITYVFDATSAPATVQFALEPAHPGVKRFTLQVPDGDPLSARVTVMP